MGNNPNVLELRPISDWVSLTRLVDWTAGIDIIPELSMRVKLPTKVDGRADNPGIVVGSNSVSVRELKNETRVSVGFIDSNVLTPVLLKTTEEVSIKDSDTSLMLPDVSTPKVD